MRRSAANRQPTVLLAHLSLMDLTALHNERHSLKRGDVFERVANDGHDVGVLPGSIVPGSFSASSNSSATSIADRIACIEIHPITDVK